MTARWTRPPGQRLRSAVVCVVAGATLLITPAAQAVLGGDVSTIGADQARFKGQRQQAVALRVRVESHEITLGDGSSIREFVAPNGIVFAVAWSTRFKPNLESLLGQHAATYASAARDALKTPGIKRSVVLQRDDLVVRSTAHLNAFVGKAYLRSLVPEGVRVDELR